MKQITVGVFEASLSEVPRVFPSDELCVQGDPSTASTQGWSGEDFCCFLSSEHHLDTRSSPTCNIWTWETLQQRQLWSGQSPALADAVPSVVFWFNFILWTGLTASADKSERSQPLLLALWLIICTRCTLGSFAPFCGWTESVSFSPAVLSAAAPFTPTPNFCLSQCVTYLSEWLWMQKG